MKDTKLGILLLVISLLLLGVVFFVNVTHSLDFLQKPVEGRLGLLCDSYEDCVAFCQDNRGRCDDYCYTHTPNHLCGRLFGRPDGGSG
jgi:hypothetical protein